MVAAGMKIVLFSEVQVLQFLRGILKREFKATDMEIRQMIKNPVTIPAGLEVYWLRTNPDIAYVIDQNHIEQPPPVVETQEVEVDEVRHKQQPFKKGKK